MHCVASAENSQLSSDGPAPPLAPERSGGRECRAVRLDRHNGKPHTARLAKCAERYHPCVPTPCDDRPIKPTKRLGSNPNFKCSSPHLRRRRRTELGLTIDRFDLTGRISATMSLTQLAHSDARFESRILPKNPYGCVALDSRGPDNNGGLKMAVIGHITSQPVAKAGSSIWANRHWRANCSATIVCGDIC